ncbi:hypothetical protein BC830DRAFT_1233852 [Chytriomyces sp. MP71]|nr:hypothetical protein BC830DRAFT_1233852 [Chytriomyces sp. MP71]
MRPKSVRVMTKSKSFVTVSSTSDAVRFNSVDQSQSDAPSPSSPHFLAKANRTKSVSFTESGVSSSTWLSPVPPSSSDPKSPKSPRSIRSAAPKSAKTRKKSATRLSAADAGEFSGADLAATPPQPIALTDPNAYPPTPLQRFIAGRAAAVDVNSLQWRPAHYSIHCYRLQHAECIALQGLAECLEKAVGLVAAVYPVLATDATLWRMDPAALPRHAVQCIDGALAAVCASAAVLMTRTDAQLFVSVLAPQPNAVLLCFSDALADALSATLLSKQMVALCARLVHLKAAGRLESAILDTSTCAEATGATFPDMARLQPASADAEAYALFWRNVFAEGVEAPVSIDGYDRAAFETRRLDMEHKVETLHTLVAALEEKRAAQEAQVAFLRRQRRDMDSYDDTPSTTMVDPLTGEPFELTRAARAAILYEVLGEEVAADEGIEALLARHEVSPALQGKVGKTLSKFSAMDNESLLAVGLLGKDRRKLLALSEHLKSKVSESLQEQDKVKASVERKILKSQRELDDTIENLTKAAQTYKTLKIDLEIRSRVVKDSGPLNKQIAQPHLGLNSGLKAEGGFDQLWSYCPFEIDADLSKSIRAYANELNKSVAGGRMSDTLSALFLTSLFIVIKHVSGLDQFLIGAQVNPYTSDTVLIGPNTETIPTHLLINNSSISFNDLLSAMLANLTSLTSACRMGSPTAFASQLKLTPFALRFAFHSNAQVCAWQNAGMSRGDLLGVPTNERIFYYESGDASQAGMVLLDTGDAFTGHIRYRKAVLAEDAVDRWIAKFKATLECLEGKRVPTVGQIVSKYYHAALGSMK